MGNQLTLLYIFPDLFTINKIQRIIKQVGIKIRSRYLPTCFLDVCEKVSEVSETNE